jgi:hypothetical protein
MTQQTRPQAPKPVPNHPAPAQDVINERAKAEQNEVAGRHKNSGQKDHKGAR